MQLPASRLGRLVSLRWVLAWFGLLALSFSGCGLLGQGSRPPDRELTKLWRTYREIPSERALAIAGELRRDQWVAGASGGHDSMPEAEAGALAECQKRRVLRRIQAPCSLYAVGDEVVWKLR